MSYLYFDKEHYKTELERVQQAADKLTRNFAKIVSLDMPGLATREYCLAATLDDDVRQTGAGWYPSAELQQMTAEGIGLGKVPKRMQREAISEIFDKLFFPIKLVTSDVYGFRNPEPEHLKWELEKIQDNGFKISKFVRQVVYDLDFSDGVFTIGEKVAKRLKDRHTYKPKGREAEKAISLLLEIEKDFKQLAKVLPLPPQFGESPLLLWKEYIYYNTNTDGSLDEQDLWYRHIIESDTESSFRDFI